MGDIVIPGIFIALLLRFDYSRHLDRASSARSEGAAAAAGAATAAAAAAAAAAAPAVTVVAADFEKPVFNATIISYVLGLVATVLVMYAFHAAQPALL